MNLNAAALILLDVVFIAYVAVLLVRFFDGRRIRGSWLESHVATTVLVTKTDGQTIGGVIAGVYRDSIALRHAAIMLDDGERVPMEGEIVILRGSIEIVQADPKFRLDEARRAVPVRTV